MYKVNILRIKFWDILAYFYALDTFIEIRRAVPPSAVISSAQASLFSGSAPPVVTLHKRRCRTSHTGLYHWLRLP